MYYSDVADLRISAILAAEMQLLLADRASLWRHPALAYLGDVSGSGSATSKIPFVGFGMDAMSAIAETGSATDTAVANSSVNISIARQVLQRSISDLAGLTDSVGFNVQALVNDGFAAAEQRFSQMVCESADFSTVVGTSGSSLSVNNWFNAMYALTQASNDGPAVAILYPKQWTDLQSALRAETSNVIAFTPATAELIALKGTGYAGNVSGVDVYLSTHVPAVNAGADSAGSMFCQGAIGYVEGSVTQIRGGGEVIAIGGTPIFTEISRDSSGALTKIVHNYYAGVDKLQDLKGVALVTDR